jgi:hypothetical protein
LVVSEKEKRMGTFNKTGSWQSPLDAELVHDRIVSLIEARGGKVQTAPRGAVTGTLGSKLALRMGGAALTKDSHLPVKIEVRISPQEEGCSVSAAAEDNAGFGVKAGLRGKYERSFSALLDYLHRGTTS